MDLQFQHTIFAYLFFVIPFLLILFLWYQVWRRRVSKRIGNTQLVQTLISDYSGAKSRFKFFLLLLAFGVGTIAALNPQRKEKGKNIVRNGIDIAIALDVSNSMLANDVVPNRLEKAKQFISKLLVAFPNDRVALVLFAGKAYLQMPLTTDRSAASLFITSASTGVIQQQGTVLSAAMEMCANAFIAAGNQFKTVVLVTDGEGHDDEAASMAKKLAQQGIMINTVGIGSPEGSNIPGVTINDLKKDETGEIVISKLNENLLKDIAAATNGIYVRLQDIDLAVGQLKQQMAQIDKKAFTDTSLLDYKNYFLWFAAAMLLLLLIEIFISERKNVTSKAVMI